MSVTLKVVPFLRSIWLHMHSGRVRCYLRAGGRNLYSRRTSCHRVCQITNKVSNFKSSLSDVFDVSDVTDVTNTLYGDCPKGHRSENEGSYSRTTSRIGTFPVRGLVTPHLAAR